MIRKESLTQELVEQILKIPHWYKYLVTVIDIEHFMNRFPLLVDFAEENYEMDLIEHLDRVIKNAIDNFSQNMQRPAVALSYFMNNARFIFYKNKRAFGRADFLVVNNQSYHAKFLCFYYLVQQYYTPKKLMVYLYKFIPYKYVNAHKYIFNRYLDTNFYYSFIDASREFVESENKFYTSLLGIITELEL